MDAEMINKRKDGCYGVYQIIGNPDRYHWLCHEIGFHFDYYGCGNRDCIGWWYGYHNVS